MLSCADRGLLEAKRPLGGFYQAFTLHSRTHIALDWGPSEVLPEQGYVEHHRPKKEMTREFRALRGSYQPGNEKIAVRLCFSKVVDRGWIPVVSGRNVSRRAWFFFFFFVFFSLLFESANYTLVSRAGRVCLQMQTAFNLSSGRD